MVPGEVCGLIQLLRLEETANHSFDGWFCYASKRDQLAAVQRLLLKNVEECGDGGMLAVGFGNDQ